MKCPICTDAALAMTDRQGIEIDYCPQCRGVWLDRGELDKLLERAVTQQPVREVVARSNPDFEDSAHRGSPGQRPRPRKSWLSEILD